MCGAPLNSRSVSFQGNVLAGAAFSFSLLSPPVASSAWGLAAREMPLEFQSSSPALARGPVYFTQRRWLRWRSWLPGAVDFVLRRRSGNLVLPSQHRGPEI